MYGRAWNVTRDMQGRGRPDKRVVFPSPPRRVGLEADRCRSIRSDSVARNRTSGACLHVIPLR